MCHFGKKSIGILLGPVEAWSAGDIKKMDIVDVGCVWDVVWETTEAGCHLLEYLWGRLYSAVSVLLYVVEEDLGRAHL